MIVSAILMEAKFPAIFLLFVLTFCSFASSALSSPVGVGSISRLLEIQNRERASPSVQEAAARAVLHRLLPSHSSSFDFRIVSKEQCGGEYCFMIRNHPSFRRAGDPEILLAGTTGVEVIAGLHWYLKHWCGSHISWDKTGGSQLFSVPKAGFLPRVHDTGILVKRPIPWSYYQNAVTSSYSFAWWDWKRWEKEIDWMALQGVNLPLAFTGQEAIWQKVFQEKFNMSNSDLNDFFGGPAFLSWSRMANLHAWGGPLPQSWLDQQLILQKKILARMYELGMTPVLPAFSGNVPAALKNAFPSAKITRLGNWFSVKSDPRWCCTYLLDATDPLFIEIGKAFVERQLLEYGTTSHIFNCDTFDENTPPVDDPEYISSLGAAIFKGMESGDSEAVWLMQGWLFSYDPFWRPPQMKALLHSVPVGKLVVLDLFAEVKPIWITSEQFYGVPYVWKVAGPEFSENNVSLGPAVKPDIYRGDCFEKLWWHYSMEMEIVLVDHLGGFLYKMCMLHNFAGNIEMYGILDAIASGPIEARKSVNSTMVGVGMSMEGIEQNPIVYDLMSEMAFHHEKLNVKAWVDRYSTRRYGRPIPSIQGAWNILYHTVYNCTDGTNNKNRDIIVAFPDVDPSLISVQQEWSHHHVKPESRTAIKEVADSYDRPHLWYSASEVIRSLKLFISNGDELSRSSTYRYDLVDLTRQALAKYANQLFLKVIEAYQSQDVHGVAFHSQKFLDLVEDMDTLLACHDGFLLGPWLESAKQLAQNERQAKQFEWNARTQITMWYDNTEEEPSLLRDYGNKYWSGLLRDYYGPRAAIYFKYLIESLKRGEDFRLEEWRREWIKHTNDWQSRGNIFSVRGTGDALNTSKWLFNKYLSNPGMELITPY